MEKKKKKIDRICDICLLACSFPLLSAIAVRDRSIERILHTFLDPIQKTNCLCFYIFILERPAKEKASKQAVLSPGHGTSLALPTAAHRRPHPHPRTPLHHKNHQRETRASKNKTKQNKNKNKRKQERKKHAPPYRLQAKPSLFRAASQTEKKTEKKTEKRKGDSPAGLCPSSWLFPARRATWPGLEPGAVTVKIVSGGERAKEERKKEKKEEIKKKRKKKEHTAGNSRLGSNGSIILPPTLPVGSNPTRLISTKIFTPSATITETKRNRQNETEDIPVTKPARQPQQPPRQPGYFGQGRNISSATNQSINQSARIRDDTRQRSTYRSRFSETIYILYPSVFNRNGTAQHRTRLTCSNGRRVFARHAESVDLLLVLGREDTGK